MERWEATISLALQQVEQARSEDLDIKIQRAGMAIENLLKAVLMKVGKYIDESSSGDRHHKCIKLYRKIKEEGCIDENIIKEMEEILIDNRLIYMDQKLLNTETTAGFYPNIRYPFEVEGVWISIVEHLSPEILKEKYELLIKLRDLIKGNL